jgi:hypothetical protein
MRKNMPTFERPLRLLNSVELFNLRRKQTSPEFDVQLHCSAVTINSLAGLSLLLHQQLRIQSSSSAQIRRQHVGIRGSVRWRFT